MAWLHLTPPTVATGSKDPTIALEMACRKALENFEKDPTFVKDLEAKLSITVRWTPECEEWTHAGGMVAMQRYQCALDQLEGLIVAQMFELTKMNMSQTGMYPTALN